MGQDRHPFMAGLKTGAAVGLLAGFAAGLVGWSGAAATFTWVVASSVEWLTG